jgi:hypothetical protein
LHPYGAAAPAVDELHREEMGAGLLPDAEDGNDVRAVEQGHGPRFAAEVLDSQSSADTEAERTFSATFRPKAACSAS